MRPDMDLTQAINDNIITDIGVVTNRDIPWIGNFSGRSNSNVLADFSSKQSKQEAAPTNQKMRRGMKQNSLHKVPRLYEKLILPLESSGRLGTAQVLNAWAHT